MNNNKFKSILPIIFGIVIVIIDYITKLVITYNILPEDYHEVMGDFLRLTFQYNENFPGFVFLAVSWGFFFLVN